MAGSRKRTEGKRGFDHIQSGAVKSGPGGDPGSAPSGSQDVRVAVALLTWNRLELFKRTFKSLMKGDYPFDLCIVDNGSTDGTAKEVAKLGGYCNTGRNHTAGHGMNLAIEAALKYDPDLVVFTADDYEYKGDWLKRLVAFWQEAPGNVALVSCNLEPVYGWNTVQDVIEVGRE